ncbi:uncharacterized protein LOC131695829 [Topomyia yanbarensis]|uniref:uncharacterized protein LOC131695829 n=1 Tax=Topomyia yanbarensis TaxID=2498891 RepID=UPI00273C005A|nr:uncharacterized protein LOC131695829 [Topomyia yanbarensis]
MRMFQPCIPIVHNSSSRIRYKLQNSTDFYNFHQQLLSTDEAFLSWSTGDTMMNAILPYIGHRNHQAKIVLISYRLPSNKMADIFYNAWYRYKLLNVFLINLLEGSRIEACMFNPFHKDKHRERILSSDLFCTIMSSSEPVSRYLEQLDDFTHNRVSNLNGYTLTIAMHESEGSMSAFDCVLENLTLSDIDMEILMIIKEKMNFTISFVASELELSMGYIFPNGSLAGSLGLIENNQIDMAANSRIIYNYGTSNLLYLNHIGREKLVFLVPSDYFKNRDKRIIFINPFSIAYLIVNFILALTIPLISFTLEKYLHYLGIQQERADFGNCALQILGIIYNISGKLPKAPKRRWILFGLLVYNIVSYPVWQAVTIRYLNSDNHHLNNINNIDELLESNLTLKVSNYHRQMVTHASSHSLNPNYRELTARLTTENTTSIRAAIQQIIIQRDSAFLISHIYVPLIKSGSNKWIHGHSSGVYAISEPVYEFYKAMVVPKTSPFWRSFNEIIIRCVQSGFIDYQRKRVQIVVNQLEIRHQLALEMKNNKRVFDMEVLWIFFVFYLLMVALSTVVFVLEIIVHRYDKIKRVYRRQQQGSDCTEYWQSFPPCTGRESYGLDPRIRTEGPDPETCLDLNTKPGSGSDLNKVTREEMGLIRELILIHTKPVRIYGLVWISHLSRIRNLGLSRNQASETQGESSA